MEEPQKSQEQPYDIKNSNFFTGIEQSNSPKTQSPQEIGFNPYLAQQNQNTTFFDKVNSTANGVFDFIKNKTPANMIPKKLLNYENNLTTLTNIKQDEIQNIINNTKKETQTQQLVKTKLNDLTILVNISNPRVITNSLFKTNYVLYDVSTQQMNWLVNRRYSDFIWLRDCLQSLFPADMIPLLPKKKIGNRRFQEDFLKKRTDGLQKFINEIVNNEKYKATEILNIFLSCVERNFFEQQMKIITPKLLLRQNVFSIQSFEGKLNIIDINNINNNSQNIDEIFLYFSQITNFLNSQNDALNEIQNNLKKYIKTMEYAYSYLEEIEKNFNKLYEISNNVKLSQNVTNVYNQYENFFSNWKNVQTKQTLIIKDVVKKYFKNVEQKSENLIEILNKEKNIQDDFCNFKNKLLAKKELLWQQMDVSKWDLNQNNNNQLDQERLFKDKLYAQENMCSKESMDLKLKGDLLGYFFYENYDNFKKILGEWDNGHLQNITEFTNQIYPSFSDLINVWSNVVSNIHKA